MSKQENQFGAAYHFQLAFTELPPDKDDAEAWGKYRNAWYVHCGKWRATWEGQQVASHPEMKIAGQVVELTV